MRRLWIAVGALAGVGMFGCFSVPTGQPVAPFPDPGAPQVVPGTPVPPGNVQYVSPFGPTQPAGIVANPLRVPVADREFAFEQIVAVIEEFFKIQHEEPVRVAGDILTEGRIDTYPEISATLLEPWRGDTVTFRDKLESTLQTYRRRAFVRIMPDQGSFFVELTVIKELEDLRRPQMAIGAAVFDKQNTTLDRVSEPLPGQPDVPPFATATSVAQSPLSGRQSAPPAPSNWIPQGRDAHLEQVILGKIQARLLPFGAPAFIAPGGTVGLPPSF
jgi:hypothetical protein